ncbi:MAG: nucleoside hydrolase [Pleomorphochaeta sp.]
MKKVILDSDMVEGFDDGVALLLLEKASNIDLLGVTTVSGNSNVEVSIATAIKQLEIINSTTPIYKGNLLGINENRYKYDFFREEENLVSKIRYSGFLTSYINSKEKIEFPDFKKVYSFFYKNECTYKNIYYPNKVDEKGIDNAVDFLINQVNKYPNEITILSIGPLTNIAKAIKKDPSFPSKVKEIVYMGGAFFVDGNSTKNAEFNWWFDPDATKICINSKWGKEENDFNNQIIFSLETALNTKRMPQALYEKILKETYPEFKTLLLKSNGMVAPFNIWDVLAASYVINPSIVISWNNDNNKEKKGVYIDIETELNSNYSKAFAYKEYKPKCMKAIIANKINDEFLFNKILYPLLKQ